MNKRENLNRIGKIAGVACAIMLTVLPGACLANGQRSLRAEGQESKGTEEVTTGGVLTEVELAAGSQNEEGKEKTLTFEKYTHDFGRIRHEDGEQACSFKYTNKSDTTILIYDVRAYCNCTKVEWSRKPIKPGESGEIKVKFDNNDKPQNFSRSMKVTLSTDVDPILLTIRGKIVE